MAHTYVVTADVYVYYMRKHRKILTDTYVRVMHPCAAIDAPQAIDKLYKLYGYGSHVKNVHAERQAS